MARKPKPAVQKRVEGTARRDRINEQAPAAAAGTPVAPEWLDEASMSYFRQIVAILERQNRASPDHQDTITNAALALGEVYECSVIIADWGRSYETVNGQGGKMWRPRPEVAQRSDAMRRAQSCLSELGLTPASVGKVSTGEQSGGNPFADL